MIHILTHRGLDPLIENFPVESSLEAFTNQLERNYGLEFNLQETKDSELVVIHDSSLKRISNGKDSRFVKDINLSELLSMNFDGCHLVSAKNLIQKIIDSKVKSISAVHIKKQLQTPECLDKILELFDSNSYENFLFFDLSVDAAKYLYQKNNLLQVAASVAHPYDIERYNKCVGGTLIPMHDLILNKHLFKWAWLDEWDLTDVNGGNKTLVNESTVLKLRKLDIKIAIVSPELHSHSPGLYGGESHQSALNFKTLTARIEETIKLKPDLICTDYPDILKELSEKFA